MNTVTQTEGAIFTFQYIISLTVSVANELISKIQAVIKVTIICQLMPRISKTGFPKFPSPTTLSRMM